LDGTKMLANASTHRSVPHKKLSEHELYWKTVVDSFSAADFKPHSPTRNLHPASLPHSPPLSFSPTGSQAVPFFLTGSQAVPFFH
jgi:hypothetical protein